MGIDPDRGIGSGIEFARFFDSLERRRALELLVIVSVIGLWCFEFGSDTVLIGVSWCRPLFHALKSTRNQGELFWESICSRVQTSAHDCNKRIARFAISSLRAMRWRQEAGIPDSP